MSITLLESVGAVSSLPVTSNLLTFVNSTGNPEFGAVCLTHNANPGAYTPPAGWTQLGSTLNSSSGTTPCFHSFWTKKNPGAATFTWTWTNATAVIIYGKRFYTDQSGIGSIDISSTKTGSDTNPDVNGIITTHDIEVVLASFGQSGAAGPVWSALNESFIDVSVDFASNVAGTGGIFHRITTSTGNYGPSLASDTNDDWATFGVGIYEDTGPVNKQGSDSGALTDGKQYKNIYILLQQSDLFFAASEANVVIVGIILQQSDGITLQDASVQLVVLLSKSDSYSFADGLQGILYIFTITDSILLDDVNSFFIVVALSQMDSITLTELTGYSLTNTIQNSDVFSLSERWNTQNNIQQVDFGQLTEQWISQNTIQQNENGSFTEQWGSRFNANQADSAALSDGQYGLNSSSPLTDSAAFFDSSSFGTVLYSQFDSAKLVEKSKVDPTSAMQESGVVSDGYSLVVLSQGKIIPIIGTDTTKIIIIGTIVP